MSKINSFGTYFSVLRHNKYKRALEKLAGPSKYPPKTEEAALLQIEVQEIAREALYE